MADEVIKTLAVKVALENGSFQDGMTSMKRQMQGIDSAFKASVSGVKDWGSSLDGLRNNLTALGEKLSIQKQVVSQYQAQLEKAKSALEQNSQKMLDNQAKLEAAKKAYDESASSIGKNADETKKLKEQLDSAQKTYDSSESLVRKNNKAVEGYTIQLNDARGKLQGMESELSEANSKMRSHILQWDALKTELQESGKAFESAGSKLTGIGKTLTSSVTTALAAAGVGAAKMSSDFEDGQAKISTIADTSEMSMNKIGNGLLDLSNKVNKGVGDLQEGEYQAISSGVKTGETLNFMATASKAAIGGFTDTDTAVDGLTTVLNAYGLQGKDAIDIANQMMVAQNLGKTTFGEMAQQVGNAIPTFATANVSTKEFFSSLGVLTANGIHTREAVTGLKAALSNVIKPTDEAAKAADSLGLKFNASELKSKGWMGFLQEVKEKLKQVSPAYSAAAEKVSSLTVKISELSKSGGKNSDELKKMKAELKNAKSDMTSLESASNSQLSAFATMFGSVEGLNSVLTLTSDQGIQLYNESMKEMGSNTNYVEDAFNKINGTPSKQLGGTFNDLKNTVIQFGTKLNSTVMPPLETLKKYADELYNKAKNLTGAQAQMIVKFAGLAAAAGPFTIGLGTAMKEIGKFQTGLGTGAEAVDKFVNDSKGKFDLFKKSAASLGSNIGNLGGIQKLQTAAGTLGSKFQSAVAPVTSSLTKIKSSITTNLGGATTKVFDKLPTGLKTNLTKMSTGLTAEVPKLKGVIGQLGGGITSGLQSMVAASLKLFAPAVLVAALLVGLGAANQQMNGQLTTMIQQVAAKGPQLIQSFVNSITAKIPALIDEGTKVLNALINAISTNGPVIIAGAVKIITTLVDGLAKNLPTLIPAALSCVSTLANALVDNLPLILQSGIKLLVALVEGITKDPEKLVNTIVNLVIKISDVLIQNLPLIIEAAVKIMVALITGLAKALPQLVASIPKIVSAIWDSLTKVNWLQLGIDILKGIGQGLLQIGSALGGVIKEAGNGILNGFKKLFGIHSPSTVMRDEVGQYLSLGILEGINSVDFMQGIADNVKKSTGTISAQIVKFTDTISSKINSAANGITKAFKKASVSSLTNEIKNLSVTTSDYQQRAVNLTAAISLSQQKVKDLTSEYNNLNKTTKSGAKEATELKKQIDSTNLSITKLKNQASTAFSALTQKANDFKSKLTEYTNTLYNNITSRMSKLKTDIQSVIDDYKQQVSDLQSSIYNSTGLFDAVSTPDSAVTGDTLTANLQGQVDQLNTWQSTLKSLEKKHVSSGLLKELQKMGPSATTSLQALNDMTSGELDDYVNLWKEKTKLSKQAAEKELTAEKSAAQSKIQQLESEAQTDVNAYVSAWGSSTKTITDQLSGLAKSAGTWGKDMIQGIIGGINSQKNNLSVAASKIAQTISSKLHFSEPDEGPLHGYHTWMPDFLEGLSRDITANKYKVSQAIQGLSSDMSMGARPQYQAAYAEGYQSVPQQAGSSMQQYLYATVNIGGNKVDSVITPIVGKSLESGAKGRVRGGG